MKNILFLFIFVLTIGIVSSSSFGYNYLNLGQSNSNLNSTGLIINWSSSTYNDGWINDTFVKKSGDTMTGDLRLNGSKITAGTLTDSFLSVYEILRNNVIVGRIDNNANGLRVQALINSLQLRNPNNRGMTINNTDALVFDSSISLYVGSSVGWSGNCVNVSVSKGLIVGCND